MVDTQVKLIAMHILRKMDKTGATVFKNIIDQFLHDTEDDQFFFGFEPVLVIMEAAAGIHRARAADLLKQVIDG